MDCVGHRKPKRVQLHPYSFLKVVPEVKNSLNCVHIFLKSASYSRLKRSHGMSLQLGVASCCLLFLSVDVASDCCFPTACCSLCISHGREDRFPRRPWIQHVILTGKDYGRGGTWILVSIRDGMSHFILDSLIGLCLFDNILPQSTGLLLKFLRTSLAKS